MGWRPRACLRVGEAWRASRQARELARVAVSGGFPAAGGPRFHSRQGEQTLSRAGAPSAPFTHHQQHAVSQMLGQRPPFMITSSPAFHEAPQDGALPVRLCGTDEATAWEGTLGGPCPTGGCRPLTSPVVGAAGAGGPTP